MKNMRIASTQWRLNLVISRVFENCLCLTVLYHRLIKFPSICFQKKNCTMNCVDWVNKDVLVGQHKIIIKNYCVNY